MSLALLLLLVVARPERQDLGVQMPDAPSIQKLVIPPELSFADGDLGDHRLERVDEDVTFDPARGTASANVSATLIAGPGGQTNV